MPFVKTPIKLVVLLQDLEFGGTQRYAIHLLTHLNRALFSPELWVLRGGTDMVPMALAAGITVVHLSGSSWVSPQALGHLAWRLARNRPQLLYTLTVVPNIWGRIFGRIARVPVIVSGYRSLFPKQHEKWLWPLADRIICNAEAVKDVMIRHFSVDAERIAVIPNAVDTNFFCPDHDVKASEPTVLYVGRLVAEKDPLNLAEGFRLAADRIPTAQFEIIGNGPLKTQLEARIRDYSLESRVKLLPGTADIRPNLRRSWVFTLPSLREASPNVIIEAMATGLPIVATRVGGIPELVQHGQTGLLVEPGDPEGLAEALTTLLTNETLRFSMGLKARERVLAYHSLDYMVRETERVLMDAVRERTKLSC